MSQGFSLKYDRMKENAPELPSKPSAGIVLYDNAGHDRKLCFVLADGSLVRLNYGYLIWDEFYPDKNMIVLSFTSHTVTLTGQHLQKLHADLEQNLPRVIALTDARYNMTLDDEQPVVNEIKIVIN